MAGKLALRAQVAPAFATQFRGFKGLKSSSCSLCLNRTCTGPSRQSKTTGRLRMQASHRLVVLSTAADTLELTEENVEIVLDEVRPYLMADGGDVELAEIDGLVVKLRLKGACGSCPSSLTTMQMGIQRRLQERIPEVMDVVQIQDEQSGLELTEENVDQVLDEIRPYLVGTGGGELVCKGLDGPIVKVQITGPAASVMTVRVAVTQKLREKIPAIAAVQLIEVPIPEEGAVLHGNLPHRSAPPRALPVVAPCCSDKPPRMSAPLPPPLLAKTADLLSLAVPTVRAAPLPMKATASARPPSVATLGEASHRPLPPRCPL
eukprot:CAMPEP_0177610094 /NCGR_PEP_ID=MMETSP0419_2-20121207/19548_1 /TAXON_ID=582737 /ORGANISM="Tetraselmis sp., Strain GSL018" /LENGTH=318 /DNA_ID=CAMNT_0019105281 /DNA_START=126 /DNA_END=1084 /DNA_ORIENTATION=+